MPAPFQTILASGEKQLKASEIRVSIQRKGDARFLRATLPQKPGSGHIKPRRYVLKIGLSVS